MATTFVSLLGSLGPALFRAITLNWYSPFSFRFFTVNVRSVTVSLVTGPNLVLYLSLDSTMYSVIGLPPSESGAVHERVTEVGVMLDAFGTPGALGSSV